MASLTNIAFLDFETRSKESIEHGAAKYAAHNSTDILLAGYAIENEPAVCYDIKKHFIKLTKLYEFIMDGGRVVAHNMLFEAFIIKYVGRPKYNWPSMKYSQFLDTMHMAGRAGLPLSLADCAKSLKVLDKLEEGKDLINLFSIPQKDGQFIEMDSRPREKERFIEYCATDCEVSREIWSNLPAFSKSETEDIELDLRSNMNGIYVDINTANIINKNIEIEQAKFSDRACELTGNIITKMTQVVRLKNWVQEHVNPNVPNCAADTIIELLDGKYGKVDEVTEELLLMRQHSGKSSTGKYQRYVNSSIDNYIYGMIISFGAHTGRGISRLLNLYNLPKPSVKYESMDELIEDLSKDDIDFINEKYGSYLKAASSAIRGIITAPKDHKLYVADYAAIEARIVFWLANCLSGLKKYYNKIDHYKDMATTVFDKSYDKIVDDERWVGKQIILGCGYGLGWAGFQNTCRNYGRELSDELCQDSVNSYRNSYPEVVDLWNDLDRQSLLACRTGKVTYAANGRIAFRTYRTKSGVVFLLMRLPSGRFLSYPDVKIIEVTTPWGAKRKAVSYKKLVNNVWIRESTYGGKLTENACQGIARDIMYYGAKVASRYGYRFLFGVYDELISQSKEINASLEEYCSLICQKESWAEGLPIEAEGKVLQHYQKI